MSAVLVVLLGNLSCPMGDTWVLLWGPFGAVSGDPGVCFGDVWGDPSPPPHSHGGARFPGCPQFRPHPRHQDQEEEEGFVPYGDQGEEASPPSAPHVPPIPSPGLRGPSLGLGVPLWDLFPGSLCPLLGVKVLVKGLGSLPGSLCPLPGFLCPLPGSQGPLCKSGSLSWSPFPGSLCSLCGFRGPFLHLWVCPPTPPRSWGPFPKSLCPLLRSHGHLPGSRSPP